MELSWISVFFLALIEGITEFVPVSSTGHMILFSSLLGLNGDGIKALEVVVQGGAILAVCVVFRRQLFEFCTKQNGLWFLAVTSMPALFVAFFAESYIKHYLFTPLTVAIGLIFGAMLMMLNKRYQNNTREISSLTTKQAMVIGVFQILALWPGVSRSTSSIVGGLVSGLSLPAAAIYSFYAAVPLLLAATVHELLFSWQSLSSAVPWQLVCFAMLVAFVVALFSLRILISCISSWGLKPFIYYRLLLAGIILFIYFLL